MIKVEKEFEELDARLLQSGGSSHYKLVNNNGNGNGNVDKHFLKKDSNNNFDITPRSNLNEKND